MVNKSFQLTKDGCNLNEVGEERFFLLGDNKMAGSQIQLITYSLRIVKMLLTPEHSSSLWNN